MGKPNFSFQKRQKELAKKKKNEEKRQRKLAGKSTEAPVADHETPAEPGADDRGAATIENAGWIGSKRR